jgi:hypothetical protein
MLTRMMAMLENPNITEEHLDAIERIDKQIHMTIISSAQNEGIVLHEKMPSLN